MSLPLTYMTNLGTTTQLLGAIVSISIAFSVATIFYNLYLHPLAKYPGPLLWKCSRFFFCRSLSQGNLVHDTKRLHDKFGKIVRLAPNEVSFIDAGAWRDIYGHRAGHEEFIKNPVWTSKAPNGVYPIIDAPQEDHDRQRKILNYAFSAKALKAQEPILQEYTSILISKLRLNGISEMRDWFTYVSFDITGDLTFGQSFRCMEQGTSHEWVANLFSHTSNAVLLASVKFYPLLAKIAFQFLPKKTFEQRKYQFSQTVGWVHKRLASKSDRADFMSYVMSNNDGRGMTTREIEASASVLVVAGSETTSTQLLGTLKTLMQHPDKLAKLATEIREKYKTDSEITLESLDDLAYLKAVFLENFRLNPPVPTQIPTVVPAGGDTVCNEFLPGGTCVAIPQFAAYRSPLNFTHASRFIPERWLTPTSPLFRPGTSDPFFDKHTFALDATSVLQPFSVGPRNCIGQYLAHAEMRLIMTKVLWFFDPVFPDDMEVEERRKEFGGQITYGLWVKKPFRVQMIEVKRS